MLETPPKLSTTHSGCYRKSKNVADMGTISREDFGKLSENPQRLYVWNLYFLNFLFMDLSSQWIVGFVDGEGCFHVSVNPDPEMTATNQVLTEFTVVLHKSDVQTLFALKGFFKCGVVRADQDDMMTFRVRNPKHLLAIICPFFMKHQLKTKKRIAFEKFRDVLLMMEKEEHLSTEGIEKIRAIASLMNRKAG